MKNATALFVIDLDTPDAQILDMANSSSQDKTHLTCLLLGALPQLPIYTYSATPYGGLNFPDDWGDLIKEANNGQNQRIEQIEAILADTDASVEIQSALCGPSEIKQNVARCAITSDIAVLAQNLRDAPATMHEAAYGVLFRSPVGLLLNGSPSNKADRIFLAWDGSSAASHAAHVALPHLKAAKEVVIGFFDPVMNANDDGENPGTDVATWLSHHGCTVTVNQFPSGGKEIGQCILDRAKEANADLVVMGAYGHSRMMQAVFGGTTRTMMDQKTLPVLLAH